MISCSTVRAVNALTARWVAAIPHRATVLTAVGVWPLLAFLLHGAAGAARRELADALEVPADTAASQSRALLAGLGAVRGVETALGVWTHEELPVESAWLDALPAPVHELLSGDPARDRLRLDAWARKCTDGRIESMPVAVDDGTLLLLAGALTVRTDWIRPFTPGATEAECGPWQGLNLASLYRWTQLLDRVGVAQTPVGPVTVLRVIGAHGVDVHLVLGPGEVPAARVLEAGVLALDRKFAPLPGDRLPLGEPGPGVTVERVPSVDGVPCLGVTTVPFSMRADHDLLGHRELFGLRAATDDDLGHFPGISTAPLAVSSAAQAMTASFGALGFRSAAVTAVAIAAGGLPRTATAPARSGSGSTVPSASSPSTAPRGWS